MCVVVPLAVTAALSAASGVVGYLGQQQAASQQEAYNQQVYEQQKQQAIAEAEYQNRQVTRNNQYMTTNAQNAISSLQSDQEALVAQERQENIAVALEIQNRRIESLRARGAIQASERAGLTLDTLLNDFNRQEATGTGVLQQNLAFASGQRVRENNKLVATANSRINEARPYESAPTQVPFMPAPVQRPSLFGAAIGTIGSVGNVINSRSVYDPVAGRYRIDTMRRLPTSLPSYSVPTRDYSQGFSKNTSLGKQNTLK